MSAEDRAAQRQASRVFACTDHDGHWPVGTASVVIAGDEKGARQLLDAKLVAGGLKPFADEPYTLTEISLNEPKAYVLCDGNY